MDDATRVLLKILRSHFEQSAELLQAWEGVPRLALMELARPGWPGEDLSKDQKAWLEFEFGKLAKSLFYANDIKSLQRFAQQAVALVLKTAPKKSKAQISKQRLYNLIKVEQLDGYEDSAVASRAAARYMNDQKRTQKNMSYIAAEPDNRLLDLLSLPKSTGAEIPKQDIRGLILKNPLAELLKKATCFAPEVVRPVLGEDLAKHLKPVGFTDKAQKVMLIEVPSSSIAHEMSFRKPEIIKRLKQLKEFEQITDIRFSTLY